MTEIVYVRRYCLFFDVLGFKDKVSKLGVKSIYDVLQEIRKTHHYREVYGEGTFSSRKVTQFSDCVVVSYLEGDFIGWMNIISDVFRLQLNLLQKGFLIRGAVTVGDLYHDDQFCFGPALIEAAELEKRAIYPRVILTDKFATRSAFENPTVNADLAAGRCINNMVAKDLDGFFYIDYFNVIPEDFEEVIEDMVRYQNDLNKQITELGNLAICDKNLESKYLWMREKFDNITSNTFSVSS